jgi:hypothetical protein
MWAEVSPQCKHLLREIHVFLAPSGSLSSSTYSGVFGSLFARVDDPLETAELLVQELANQKLFLLGVQVDSAERMILNSLDELFPSPACDRLRPMSAVFHATYCFTYAAALHSRVAVSASAQQSERHQAADRLNHRLAELEYGMKVLLESAWLDETGQTFMRALSDWSAHIRALANPILGSLGMTPAVFRHPLEVVVKPDARPVHMDGILSCRMLDEMLITLPEQKTAFSLNSSVTRIWELCNGKNTVDEIVQIIVSELGLEDSTAIATLRSDVYKSISRLGQARLLGFSSNPD